MGGFRVAGKKYAERMELQDAQELPEKGRVLEIASRAYRHSLRRYFDRQEVGIPLAASDLRKRKVDKHKAVTRDSDDRPRQAILSII